MLLKKDRLYKLALAASFAAGLWLYWNLRHYKRNDPASGFNACIFRRLTGIPCPSCGSTRSLLYLFEFHVKDAIYANPLGLILGFALITFPVWILYDIVTRKSGFYSFYQKIESLVRRRRVAIVLVCLIVANWVWNIYKYYR